MGLGNKEKVRTNIVFVAVQNGLVRAAVLTDIRQRLNDPKPEFLPLLLLVDGDIFDVSYAA